MALVDSLVKLKGEAFARTLRVAPLCPRDRLMWAPGPGALTLGQILRHMHRAELNRMKVMVGEMDRQEYVRLRHGNGTLEETLGTVTDLDAELAGLRAAHAYTLDVLLNLIDADLAKPVAWGTEEIPRLAFFILMVEHDAHHRGQLATYLRLLGVPNAKPYGI